MKKTARVAGLIGVMLSVYAMPTFVSANAPLRIDLNKTPQEQSQSIDAFEKQREGMPKPDFSVDTLNADPNNPSRMFCAKYFPINSVQTSLVPTFSDTVPGAEMTFSGSIKNGNDAPVIDGQLYVKVFYKGKDGKMFDQNNGSPVVDQFLAKDNITLAAQEQESLEVKWKVPANAPAGQYELAIYHTSAEQFNMAGLTFSDDITGNIVPFAIKGDNPAAVAFDKNTITLNGKAAFFASPPKHFGKDEPVVAQATIVNPTNQEKTVSITTNTYAWDFIRSDYLRDTISEKVTLKPNERKNLAYTAKVINDPVTLLVVKIDDNGTKSILNIRFVRDGVSSARANRLAMFQYPIKAGEQNALFGCVHAMSSMYVPGSKFTLTLKDEQGNVVHDYTYEGGISPNVMGFKNDFTPTEDMVNFTLTSRLEQPNRPAEEVTLTYNCQDIDPGLCPKSTLQDSAISFMGDTEKIVSKVILVIVGLLLLLLAGFGIRKWKNK